VLAYAALPRFRGDAQVSTWLTRIVVNEARGRLRKRRATIDLAQLDVEPTPGGARVVPFANRSGDGDPAATRRAQRSAACSNRQSRNYRPRFASCS
jgi:RNA polymerase sigma-70 factor (ECF subfamily)